MVDPAKRKLDKSNMLEHISSFYSQILTGISIGQSTDLQGISEIDFDKMILAGMGGSAIGGEVTRSFLKAELRIPFEIYRNYGLPNYANRNTLVICSSYSGSTEETLSAYSKAKELKSRIMCITTGGELAKRGAADGFPVIKLPSGMTPREALGYSITPLLIILGRLGLCGDHSGELERCSNSLKDWAGGYAFDSEPNPAYKLAEKLHGKIVIIYAGPDYLDAVAMRIKGQINENAKQPAFCNIFPEFNHNELVGWELGPDISEKFAFLILRDRADNPRIAKRMDIVKNILTGKGVDVTELWTNGERLLERMFSLIQLGDFMSYYMALLNGVDPTPVELIDFMKNELSNK
jgi:glucose/mannose-6-phosphate isomerase